MTTSERLLWAAFAVLFVVVVGASTLPVEPIVLVFPLWTTVVLGAAVATVVVAIAAVRRGWPEVPES